LSIKGLYSLAAVPVFSRVNKMTDKKQLQGEIAELLLSQRLAVLSSQTPEGSSYASLIAFAATDDLQKIVLATPRATRKFANIKYNPKVSLLIDNRSNKEQDFHDAKAVTVMGFAKELDPDASRNDLASLYLRKHPYLNDFLHSPSTAFLLVSVWRYYLVKRFQEVMELHIRDENDLSAL
jgi:nitroimidazol reductase NimA-like FMN-containing flavoprotein (pyridoxamine 5'-phosphate oxidase superfamily)